MDYLYFISDSLGRKVCACGYAIVRTSLDGAREIAKYAIKNGTTFIGRFPRGQEELLEGCAIKKELIEFLCGDGVWRRGETPNAAVNSAFRAK